VSPIKAFLRSIAHTADCAVLPPGGGPSIDGERHHVPEDVAEFYRLCGGVSLFAESDYSIEIVAPHKLRPTNERMFRGLRPDQIATSYGHPCWDWYTIADAGNGQHISVDLHPDRLGRCYDAFWETYPAESGLVATSFTDLVERLYANGGNYWYWLEADFREPMA
jgi:antitoxin YokJ